MSHVVAIGIWNNKLPTASIEESALINGVRIKLCNSEAGDLEGQVYKWITILNLDRADVWFLVCDETGNPSLDFEYEIHERVDSEFGEFLDWLRADPSTKEITVYLYDLGADAFYHRTVYSLECIRRVLKERFAGGGGYLNELFFFRRE